MEMQKKKSDRVKVMMLMDECAPNRRQWIKEGDPRVHEILENFPALSDHFVVS